MLRRTERGFTLLELLVVVAIIAILAAAIIVNLNRARGEANDSRVQSDLRNISEAVQVYITGGGQPSTLAGTTFSSLTPLTQGTDPLLPGQLPTHPSVTNGYKYRATVNNGLLNYRLEGQLTAGTDAGQCYTIINGSPTTGACTL